jgi:polyhydroxyalkanoate synthesis repressor PhaR
MTDQNPSPSTPTTIKKYANRRLYNTASSAYVTLADLAAMVKSGEDFVVFDAKSGDDITRSVLTQIIFEQEGKEGQSLLPATFLRQLIRFYGDSVQALLPSYLEFSIGKFSSEQQKFREEMRRAFGASPFDTLEEMTRKNLAAFSQALTMFTPFVAGALPPASPAPVQEKTNANSDFEELKKQLSDVQKRLDGLTKG